MKQMDSKLRMMERGREMGGGGDDSGLPFCIDQNYLMKEHAFQRKNSVCSDFKQLICEYNIITYGNYINH